MEVAFRAHDWVDRSRARVRAQRMLVQAHRATFEVESPSKLTKIAFIDQADVSMNTEQAFIERERLRRHPRIVEQLDRWWNAAAEKEGIPQDGGSLTFEPYADLHRRIFRECLGDGFNEAEARASAAEDWQDDSGGCEALDSAQFAKAIFEVADLYTLTLDAEEYVEFLNRLFRKVFEVFEDQAEEYPEDPCASVPSSEPNVIALERAAPRSHKTLPRTNPTERPRQLVKDDKKMVVAGGAGLRRPGSAPSLRHAASISRILPPKPRPKTAQPAMRGEGLMPRSLHSFALTKSISCATVHLSNRHPLAMALSPVKTSRVNGPPAPIRRGWDALTSGGVASASGSEASTKSVQARTWAWRDMTEAPAQELPPPSLSADMPKPRSSASASPSPHELAAPLQGVPCILNGVRSISARVATPNPARPNASCTAVAVATSRVARSLATDRHASPSLDVTSKALLMSPR